MAKDWTWLNKPKSEKDLEKSKKAEENKSENEDTEDTANASVETDTTDEIYFVNSKSLSLSTPVWTFKNWLFVSKNEKEANTIRRIEDYKWGFVKEYSKKEYDKMQEATAKK